MSVEDWPSQDRPNPAPWPGQGAPSTAMVLAAGLGKRLRPLTHDMPKPLIQVAGKAMIDHVLDRLAEFRLPKVVVNTYHRAEVLERHLALRTDPVIHVSRETRLMGTAGGIKVAMPLIGDDPFYVINSDALWLNGPQPMLQRMAAVWNPDAMDVLMLLMPTVRAVGMEASGDFDLAVDGRVRRPRERVEAPFYFAGVQIAQPRVFADTPTDTPTGMGDLWDRSLAEGRLYGIVHDGVWFHVGSPTALSEVQQSMHANNIRWLEQ